VHEWLHTQPKRRSFFFTRNPGISVALEGMH
jgi:hypothetical protein